jgi:hypothetical protein
MKTTVNKKLNAKIWEITEEMFMSKKSSIAWVILPANTIVIKMIKNTLRTLYCFKFLSNSIGVLDSNHDLTFFKERVKYICLTNIQKAIIWLITNCEFENKSSY